MCRFVLCIFPLFYLFVNTCSFADDTVAVVPGTFEVSPSGAATYTIPIDVPPGINGMQPNLAFVYNSQSGNGELGLGWGLSGLSAVMRCPTDLTRDGYIDPVDYDDNDQFCLGGSRYTQTVSGSTLYHEAVYSPDVGSSNKLTSYDSNGDGPDYWVLHRDDATITRFGGSPEYEVKFNSLSNIDQWLLKEVEDRFGNKVTYRYQYNQAQGISLLQTVEYSSYIVKFTYETRPDANWPKGGVLVDHSKRLKSIEVKNGVHSLRTYNLSYDVNNRQSVVSKIELCSSPTVCLETLFVSNQTIVEDFDTPAIRTYSFGSTWGTEEHYSTIQYPDVTGDGRVDVCGRASNGILCAVSDGAQFIDDKIWTTQYGLDWDYPEHYATIRFPDLNGDTKADICARASDGIICGLSNGDGFDQTSRWTSAYGASWGVAEHYSTISYPDINGDGRADICGRASNGILCAINTGTGFGTPTIWTSQYGVGWGYEEHYSTISFPDLNADGQADVCGRAADGIICGISNGATGFINTTYWTNGYSATWNTPEYYSTIRYPDLNGDGRADICGRASNGILCELNDGSGFLPGNIWTSQFGASWSAPEHYSTIVYLDLNADGLTDICGRASNGMICGFNDGQGFIDDKVWTSQYGQGWSAPEHYATIGYGDLDGDGLADICVRASNGILCGFNRIEVPRLELITTNFGAYTNIDYAYLTDPTYYIKGAGAIYPEFDFLGALPVVSQVQTDNGLGSTNLTGYAYSSMKVHRRGMGGLGFGSVVENNQSAGLVTTTFYSQDWSNMTVGMIESQLVDSSGDGRLTTTYNEFVTYTSGPVSLPFIKTSTVQKDDLNGAKMNVVTTQRVIDPNAWLLTQTVTCAGSFGVTIDRAYDCWELNKVQQVTTTYQYYSFLHVPELQPFVQQETIEATVFGPALPFQSNTQTKVKSYDYYLNTGKLKQTVVEPNTSLEITTDYEYDALLGQRTKTILSGADITTRTSESIYDNTGRYHKTINALGHETIYYYDNAAYSWKPTRIANPSTGTTTVIYDSFGQEKQRILPDGKITVTDKEWCISTCSAGELFYSYIARTGQPTVHSYYDTLGREVRTERQGQTSAGVYNFIFVTKEYDTLGRVIKVSEPYYAGEVAQYTETNYDALNRPISILEPNGNTTVINYNGNTVVRTLTPGDGQAAQTQTEIKNNAGQLITTIDNDNNTLAMQYDAFGHLVRTTDPNGNEVKVEYDIRGRKVKMDDPDQGLWTYTYYVDGKLKSQTDAKGQTTSMQYDILGRMTQRTDHNGMISSWTYDVGNYALGKLSSESSSNRFSRSINYDSLGRPITVSTTIDGQAYHITTSYDSLGRVDEVQYPTGYTTKRHYNETLGFLEKVTQVGTSNTLWEALAFSERGQLESYKLGTNINVSKVYDVQMGRLTDIAAWVVGPSFVSQHYSWSAVGNLSSRNDYVTNVTDTFTYDHVNRLTNIATVAPVSSNVSVSYDALGNIVNKSDVGGYSYGGNCNGILAGPHAVTSVNGQQYCYDQNGNMLSGDGRTVQYTTFNKPSVISKAGNTAQFWYGPNRVRFKRQDTTSQGSATTHYVGNYEKITGVGGTKEKIYIGNYAVVIKDSSGENLNYLIKDHLGSTIAATDYLGTVLERMSYDPWGKRRHTNGDLNFDLLNFSSGFTNRGFTGHEHVDSVGLVHMNGRVYDPVIGRFLSADPIIQAPGNLQSYNRYSYVWNNPLRYTDPTGYLKFGNPFKRVRKAFKRFEKSVKRHWEDIRRTAYIAVAAIGGAFVCGPQCAVAAAYGTAKGSRVYDKGASFNDAFKYGFGKSLQAYGVISLGQGGLNAWSAPKLAAQETGKNYVATQSISSLSNYAVDRYVDYQIGSAVFEGVADALDLSDDAVFGLMVGLQGYRIYKNRAALEKLGIDPNNITEQDLEDFFVETKDAVGKPKWGKIRFHTWGEGNKYNRRFNFKVETYGSVEVILTPEGTLEMSDLAMSSYNFGQSGFTHTIADVIPYMVYGNNLKDPSNFFNRSYRALEPLQY